MSRECSVVKMSKALAQGYKNAKEKEMEGRNKIRSEGTIGMQVKDLGSFCGMEKCLPVDPALFKEWDPSYTI